MSTVNIGFGAANAFFFDAAKLKLTLDATEINGFRKSAKAMITKISEAFIHSSSII